MKLLLLGGHQLGFPAPAQQLICEVYLTLKPLLSFIAEVHNLSSSAGQVSGLE